MAGVHVLVVDDDPQVRHLLCRLILHADATAQITEAATVAHARLTLQSGTICILITDFHLPDGTGLDVLHAAREYQTTAYACIVSGESSVSDLVAAAGATSFFSKPIDTARFIASLRSWIAALPSTAS